MPRTPDPLSECKKKLIDQYTIYDRAVDIVSCFESFFKFRYKDKLVYFDRFPTINIQQPPQKITPDFTVLFDNYGLIFELKKAFSKEVYPFEKELTQVKKYDLDLDFKKDLQGRRVKPKIQDIILLLDSQNSNKTFDRINKKRENDPKFKFSKNITYLDYTFKSENACYIFKSYAGDNQSFRDSDKCLENELGQNVDALVIKPDHFMINRVKGVLCNDQPPELYIAVYLWQKVFYHYLTEEQQLTYRRGNINKVEPIKINIDELTKYINDYCIENGRVRSNYIKDAISFFESADLASMNSDNEATIIIRNFKQDLKNIILLMGQANMKN